MYLLPKELKLNEICKSLSYESIINLYHVNHEFYLINKEDNLWKHLLYRDFGIKFDMINTKNIHLLYKSNIILLNNLFNKDSEINIKKLYTLYKYALKKLSKIHFIITQRTLLKVIENIPNFEWDNLCRALKEYIFKSVDHILSVNNLIEAIDNAEYEYHLIYQPIMSDIYRCKITFPEGKSNSKWSNFDIIINEIKNDTMQYKASVLKPSFIFVNERLILCKYDYELAEELLLYFYAQCEKYFEEITIEILKLSQSK